MIKGLTRFVIFLMLVFLCVHRGEAQKTVMKTNLFYWSSGTFNIAAEHAYNPNQSIELQVAYNPWTINNTKRAKHYLIRPEWRWWTCDKYNGLFLGLNLQGGEFHFSNLHMPFGLFPSLRNHRYEGYFWGGGVSVGYQWIINSRWGIESSLGLGYNRFQYDEYTCDACSPVIRSGLYNYLGLTRLSLSIVYYIR